MKTRNLERRKSSDNFFIRLLISTENDPVSFKQVVQVEQSLLLVLLVAFKLHFPFINVETCRFR
jgi:hypothetical protein